LVICPNHFRSIMSKMQVVAVDDGTLPINKRDQRALLLVVLLRNLRILDIRIGSIEIDGTDANDVLASLLRSIRSNFHVIILSSISLGGFNLVDMPKLAHDLRKPVIVVTREKPDNNAVRKALRDHFPDWRERWRAVVAAGRLYSCKPMMDEPRVYFEVEGASVSFARAIIKATAAISRLPEPIRVARILARGLSE
jgi:endonuclease V-like protein UPF0215 family